jgi:Flp pilus assembly secretin CpaC
MQEAAEDLRIPQSDIIHVDPATWERANGRLAVSAAATRVDPDDDALRRKVAETRLSGLSFTAEDGTYAEVKTRVSAITGIPLIITPQARETIDSEGLVVVMELTAPITVENFLDQMVQKSENLAWTVRDGVVAITSKALAGGQNFLEQKDVRDLIFPKTQFLPPTIRDIPTGESDSETPRTGGEGEEKTFFVEMDNLVLNIKEATDPTYWDSEGGGKIDQAESGYLLVTANPAMQKRVDGILEDLRRFATTVVTIESKFLRISQNFLQEFGVDFRGLGGSGAKGTVAVLDDITNGLDDNASRGLDNSGTADPAGNPSSGAFFNDGGDGDVRARTENFFNNSLGRSLSSTGGASAAIAFIDDLQLQMLVRAVEKRQDVQELNGQNLTVLNNERGHVAVINQTAYVRDFDVEVAQAAFIADPKIDVIQDGIVLDVKPTVSHDRRSITLEMQPTVAELVRPIPTFSTSLAGTTQPVTVQLPQLNVRSFATTVQVPDGGSVLIGGLREVLAKERRAEVPILGRIPILSFFFKQEGVVDENSSLMVLVRASITDVKSLMDRN